MNFALLDDREKLILKRLGEGKTQLQISCEINCDQGWVSRMMERSRKKVGAATKYELVAKFHLQLQK